MKIGTEKKDLKEKQNKRDNKITFKTIIQYERKKEGGKKVAF